MEPEHPAPANPASQVNPPKRVVIIGDYRGTVAGYAAVLRRRRVLRRRQQTDADNVVPLAHYFDTYKGMTETAGLPAVIPAAVPLLPDRRAQLLRWLVARLGESSTYRGLFMLAGVAGWALTGEQSEALMALGMALAGAIGVLFPDQPGTAP